MRDSYVVLNGGLGNQLWQLSFAHKLAKSRSTKVVYVRNEESNNSHLLCGVRIISELLEECPHGLEFRSYEFSCPFSRGKFVPESKWSKPWRNKTLDSRNWHWQDCYGLDLSRPYVHLGFFQNLEFLEHEVSIVLSEIQELISRQRNIKEINERESYAVIHLRGADYYQKRHRDTLGVLNHKYYLQLIDEIVKQGVKKVFVVTDDWMTAEERLRDNQGINLIRLYGLNEVSTLQLMGGAKVVGVSNSTFAWWGGMLCRKAGGSMIVPFPWYQNQKGGDPAGIYDRSMIKLPAHYSY